MSGAVKQRATVPSSPADKVSYMSRSDPKGTSNGSATLSYPAEASDDVNMNQVDGLVSLDVTLPNGKHMDITVDYNTPMRDLLVCIAGKSKLSPSGLLLQLLSEDDESTLTYKPNEVIGALGSRQVRLINKKDKETNKGKNKSIKQPFEMTNRFTVNLPRGQKAVVRVSPAMLLSDLMTSVCQDKDLDPRRHFLQLPGKPGIPIDLNATVGQLGGFEISLISNSSIQERTIANSMPDLSQVPTYMPNTGETKKKRGFLSFLKKDRKFKPHDTVYETSSTASHRMSAQIHPPPSNQRRVSDTGFESSRPKSMYVTSNPNPTEFSLPQRESNNSLSQENIAPTRKKRKAPAPPAPEGKSETISLPKQDINANVNNNIAASTSSSSSSSSNNQRETTTAASTNKSQTAPSRAEMLSRLHSRNSSDSSGYHELTLSGCESPEAGHTLTSKSKTSIDSTSIESSDINNGADSGIHESPVRVSPIEEVLEKPDASHSISTLPHPHRSHKGDNPDDYAIQSSTLPLPSRKKKKAPAPPAPSPSVQQAPPSQQPTHTMVVAADITTTTNTTTADLHVETNNQYQSVQSVQESRESMQPAVASEVSSSNHEIHPVVISPPDSFNEFTKTTPPTHVVDTSTPEYQMNEDPDLSDEDIDAAFDIDDILNGVTFDDEPKPLEIKTFSMLNNGVDEKDDRAMMMMETSSIASENIEQVDSMSRSERPCAFIPPPPPTEPPPPEVEAVTVEALNASLGPVLIDKGTEVNDDNTSLAPASVKNSPESGSFSSVGSIDTIEGLNLDFQVAIRMGEESLNPCLDDVEVSPDGYKNEMALFVERMSKMTTVENQDNRDSNALNDSLSSGLSLSETNSETGSVIQHLRTDSSDSRSGLDSGSWSKKDAIQINGIQESEEPEEVSELRVLEEITAPVETLPPPPEFDDGQGKNDEGVVDDDEEEEEYTETIEELIIPLGPDGPDFTAARKVHDSVTKKEPVVSSSVEPEDNDIKNGVFRAEPVSIIKPVSSQPIEKERKKEEKKSVVQEKEEFVLTTDDLSNVSFLPPRRKTSTSRSKTNSVSESPRNSSSSAVLIMDKRPSPRDEESSTESIQNRMSQLSFTPKSEPENDSVLEVKSISLLNRPTMRTNALYDSPSPSIVDDVSVSVAPTTHAPASPDVNETISVTNNYNESPIHEHEEYNNVEDRSPSNSLNNFQNSSAQPQDSQHEMLQMQFAQWQAQLATNQNILSQTGSDLHSEQLQQLKAQMATQQSMIQATMQALQQHQAINGGHGDKAASMEFPSVDVEQAAAAAEPPPPPPPPPPPAASSGSEPKTSGIVSKSGQNKTKSRPKPKFERELDPREQLMIAIRSFSGREGLKSVAKKDTKWIHSNR